LKHIDEVLGILEQHSFYAKVSKCEYGLTEILYLGHKISAQGLVLMRKKIKAIQDWPRPRNLSHLRGFVGSHEASVWVEIIYRMKKFDDFLIAFEKSPSRSLLTKMNDKGEALMFLIEYVKAKKGVQEEILKVFIIKSFYNFLIERKKVKR
jgi:hypothetical protein